MLKLDEARQAETSPATSKIPVSVIVAARNEARNLPRCLQSLRNMGEVYVIDSQSKDDTADIARSHGAEVVQFRYQGGWPKKRQWAMNTLPIAYDWIFLIDADEALTPELEQEIKRAIQDPSVDGYYIGLQMHFLGRRLRCGGASFYKLSLFRRGKGHFECRLSDQDPSMCDMEVHEHVLVDGNARKLQHALDHHNLGSLEEYIAKHNEYSNWDARVWNAGDAGRAELPPSLFGSQAQRRRWLRTKFFLLPGSSFLFFAYKYFFRLGVLEGIPGLIYCGLQGTQFLHIKAKIYELKKQGKG
jgi:glycosyltransferase involved in cell wall biosynthesis